MAAPQAGSEKGDGHRSADELRRRVDSGHPNANRGLDSRRKAHLTGALLQVNPTAALRETSTGRRHLDFPVEVTDPLPLVIDDFNRDVDRVVAVTLELGTIRCEPQVVLRNDLSTSIDAKRARPGAVREIREDVGKLLHGNFEGEGGEYALHVLLWWRPRFSSLGDRRVGTHDLARGAAVHDIGRRCGSHGFSAPRTR